MDKEFRQAALDYHTCPSAGKLAIMPTKRMTTQHDLSLAYSPGVAAPCLEIKANPATVSQYTARGNLVAVISNGTAVLGLGNIGPLASKPVMEGKAVLFKKFADIDVFDIEVDASDPEQFCNVVQALEPTFGAINLEDIKAPECFIIEKTLQSRMNIPVFHDDQHGTAIVVAAALVNGLLLQGKKIEEVKLVTSGAGAAAMACVDLMVTMGLKPENVTLTDIEGVVWKGRNPNMPENMARYAKETNARTLEEVIKGTDVFLGLSAAGVLKSEWLPLMADKPIIFALANPEPEIIPDIVKQVRPDAIVATGRSDYPNQVNNVLCFPFIFRGALDVGASQINLQMQHAAVHALAKLAMAEASEVVLSAYGGDAPSFGRDYILPKPFDPRLILQIAPAVAKAAMESGVATRPIEDFPKYLRKLSDFVFRSGHVMHPVFEAVKQHRPQKIVYSEGEHDRVLRAVQTVVDEHLAEPILVGKREKIQAKIKALGLKLKIDEDVRVIDPEFDKELYASLEKPYQRLVEREGIPPSSARQQVYRRRGVTAAMMLREGLVDAALIGGYSEWYSVFKAVDGIIPKRPDVSQLYTLTSLIQSNAMFFIGDAYLHLNPTAEQIAELTLLSVEMISLFGMNPRVALLSYSSFGAGKTETPLKMRKALSIIHEKNPTLEIDGEMRGDVALSPTLRAQLVDNSPLKGSANLLIMPDINSASIGLSLVRAASNALQIGPITMGATKPLHIITESTTARGILNLTAIAAKQSIEMEK